MFIGFQLCISNIMSLLRNGFPFVYMTHWKRGYAIVMLMVYLPQRNTYRSLSARVSQPGNLINKRVLSHSVCRASIDFRRQNLTSIDVRF